MADAQPMFPRTLYQWVLHSGPGGSDSKAGQYRRTGTYVTKSQEALATYAHWDAKQHALLVRLDKEGEIDVEEVRSSRLVRKLIACGVSKEALC